MEYNQWGQERLTIQVYAPNGKTIEVVLFSIAAGNDGEGEPSLGNCPCVFPPEGQKLQNQDQNQ